MHPKTIKNKLKKVSDQGGDAFNEVLLKLLREGEVRFHSLDFEEPSSGLPATVMHFYIRRPGDLDYFLPESHKPMLLPRGNSGDAIPSSAPVPTQGRTSPSTGSRIPTSGKEKAIWSKFEAIRLKGEAATVRLCAELAQCGLLKVEVVPSGDPWTDQVVIVSRCYLNNPGDLDGWLPPALKPYVVWSGNSEGPK